MMPEAALFNAITPPTLDGVDLRCVSVEALLGDCMAVLAGMADQSVDSIVCDPPYGIGFLGKSWDQSVPGVEWARECLRVLKPGGHLVAFGGTRTVHRLTVAIEDAGFEIRDQIGWVYYSGFPKSLDVSKAIDKAAGAEREVVGQRVTGNARTNEGWAGGQTMIPTTAPATPDAVKWSGWGTALKPAIEPAVLARKPLGATVAASVLEHGTGALNIDGCRFGYGDPIWIGPGEASAPGGKIRPVRGRFQSEDDPDLGLIDPPPPHDLGRWPANLIQFPKPSRAERERGCAGLPARTGAETVERAEGSAGLNNPRAGAGRTAGEVRNIHPTVKPVALMRWLVRLVTPPGGVVLDPFMGSGSCGVAAVLEGFGYVGIEMMPEYHRIAEARIAHAGRYPDQWEGGSTEREELDRAGQISMFEGVGC